MKKKLEAELISIAHRVLKLKNKSELIQLQQETQKLYEKLTVLLFVEDNFGDVKPTIGVKDITEKLEVIFENQSKIDKKKVEIQIIEEETISNQIVESEIEVDDGKLFLDNQEKLLELNDFEEIAQADVGVDVEKEELEKKIKQPVSQISFEDLLGSSYIEPVFMTPEELKMEKDLAVINLEVIDEIVTNQLQETIERDAKEQKLEPLNELHTKGISIGLNDKIAFLNHLFGNSNEDFNRVISQLITYNTFEDAQNFIDEMVKPDYNNWEGKEEYALRFMDIIERKFA